LGSARIVTVAGAALALAACAQEPQRSWTSGPTGFAGDSVIDPTGDPTGTAGEAIAPSPSGAAGFAVDGGAPFAASCSGDGGVNAGASFGGITPTIPTTVTRAQRPVPPLSGGTLLALANGIVAVVSDPERDQVYVVDLGTQAVRATITLQAGDEPGRLVEDDAGLVHVALRGGGAEVTIDPTAGTLGARRPVCSAPRGIAFDAATGLVHVACAGGELVSLPKAGGAATRTLSLRRDLRDVVVGASGTLLVSTFRAATVLVVAKDGTVSNQLQPLRATQAFTMPSRNISPSVAWRMVPYTGSSGGVVMLHQMGVDDPIDATAGAYGGVKGCASIVEAAVSVVTPDATTSSPPVSMEMVSLAIDVAVSPDGTKIAVAVPGNSQTMGLPTVVETALGIMMMGGNCVSVGPPPNATPPAGQVVAVSYLRSGVLLAQTREPAQLWRSDTSAAIPLATDSRADTGHLVFHVNAGGGLACASCHPEGGEDGRVWDFNCLGKRRTQSIRGGISATAPFHWDGAEKDFSHLMDDVFSGRMSGPPLADAQKQSLEDWVDTIKLLPQTEGLDAAAVGRGQALFNDASVGCATCHAGALLTNNTTVDVGTNGMFQVPSLRGVSWRAPFMHDGCAPTLTDRFGTCGGGDKHGATSQLTTAQLGDLVTYLQSL